MDLAHSFSYVFKRIPLEKGDKDIPTAADLRPIDIFSMIWRVVASAQSAMLRESKSKILHPMPLASRGGTLAALKMIGATCEGILWGTSHKVGLSIDFAKLLNMIDVRVAMRAAILMGLNPDDAILLADPLRRARGMWKMPLGSISPLFAKERGLPQGMSTSVMFAEIFLSFFLYRLTLTLRVQVVAYVDDINILADSPDLLKLAILQLLFR